MQTYCICLKKAINDSSGYQNLYFSFGSTKPGWLLPTTGFLIYILASQRYLTFLRPEFGILLALALFIAMGFMLAAMIRPKKEEMDTSAVLRSLVLLVPVLNEYLNVDRPGIGIRFVGMGLRM
jgi:hypothetical protein